MSTSATSTHHGSYLMPGIEHARVADAMHPGVLSCSPEATLTEAARLMASHHVHCVAVPDALPERDGETPVWSMITDRDLVRAGLAGGAEPTVGQLASTPCVTATPDTPLRDAAVAMLERDVAHALVIVPWTGRPVGVLSTLDIAGIIAWGEA